MPKAYAENETYLRMILSQSPTQRTLKAMIELLVFHIISLEDQMFLFLR